jgi:hypothetical protein
MKKSYDVVIMSILYVATILVVAFILLFPTSGNAQNTNPDVVERQYAEETIEVRALYRDEFNKTQYIYLFVSNEGIIFEHKNATFFKLGQPYVFQKRAMKRLDKNPYPRQSEAGIVYDYLAKKYGEQ